MKKILIIVIILVLAGLAGWYFWLRPAAKEKSINSFDACAAAGKPIMLSYPEQCAANGKTFTNSRQSL